MTKLSRILCAMDFSESAEAAFSRALALCRTNDAELAVVMAVPANELFSLQVRKRTAQIASLRLASQEAGVRMTVSVQQGDPVGIILRHANSRGCDFIVLGTHNRTGFDRLRAGSVAAQVTSRAARPVLVVPVTADGAEPHLNGSFENVLCSIDFSEASKAALEQALRVVDETKGRLTLVHVLPNLDPMSRYAYEVTGPYYEPLLRRNALERLEELLPSDVRHEFDVRTRVVSGTPAEQIAQVSRQINADLIVMGVTARGAIGRRLLGSTAVRVVRSAGRPILAVPERMHKAAIVNAELHAVKTIAA